MSIKIPFNKAFISGNELLYTSESIASYHISGDGVFTKRCQELLESILYSSKSLLTTSCTHALEMSALLLNVKPGDMVIIPSFTFVSTVNAFVLRGARPVFVDIRPDTLNMDEQHLAQLVTPSTKVIVPVHYAGIACEMDEIMAIANKVGASVVEDNAHGLFGKYRGRYLGTLGSMSTLSFHETKNFTCGEGGALIINDLNYASRAEIIREKGTNRSMFFRGEIDKYSWVDIGSSYLLSDLLSAYLLAQLESKTLITQRRKNIWWKYRTELHHWALTHDVKLPDIPEHCESAYHLFYFLLPDESKRSHLISHLRQAGIHASFHYIPLHLSPMGKSYGYKHGDCPVAESISEQLLRLPFYTGMSEEEQDIVISRIKSCKFDF